MTVKEGKWTKLQRKPTSLRQLAAQTAHLWKNRQITELFWQGKVILCMKRWVQGHIPK